MQAGGLKNNSSSEREKKNKMIKTPSNLQIPTFLMNFPFTVDNHTVNNVLMDLNREKYNYPEAYQQFLGLYQALVKEGSLVYILPSEKDLQDLPYTANIGCYLPHSADKIVVSNFRSEPRRGEERIGIKFFEGMRYDAAMAPYHWEGEADLKYIRDNLYIGGHGIRSDIRSYYWMEEKYDMKVVPVRMTDQYLYHFDCMFSPLSSDTALVSTSALDVAALRLLERYVKIIDVPKEFIYYGWTNIVKIGNKVFHAVIDPDGGPKILEKLLIKLGFEPVQINLSEFAKSGADLSCLIMHLNYYGRHSKKVTEDEE